MIGMVVGLEGKVPPIYNIINMTYHNVDFGHDFTSNRVLVIVGTATKKGIIEHRDETNITIKLADYICIDNDSMIIICDTDNFNIIAYGYL